MRYMDVTLSPDDIEWDRPEDLARTARQSVLSDARFEQFVEENGIDESLRAFTFAHRSVANELIRAGVAVEPFDRRTIQKIWLCRVAKRRRQTMRRLIRARDGFEAANAVIAALDVEFPRAEVPA